MIGEVAWLDRNVSVSVELATDEVKAVFALGKRGVGRDRGWGV